VLWKVAFKSNALKHFHTKGEINMPQAEGNAKSCLYSRGCSSSNLSTVLPSWIAEELNAGQESSILLLQQ